MNKLYKQIAMNFIVYYTNYRSVPSRDINFDYVQKYMNRIEELVCKYFVDVPGVKDRVNFYYWDSKPDKLIFTFRCESDGNTRPRKYAHKLFITPDFISGFNLHITNMYVNDEERKQALYDRFREILNTDVF